MHGPKIYHSGLIRFRTGSTFSSWFLGAVAPVRRPPPGVPPAPARPATTPRSPIRTRTRRSRRSRHGTAPRPAPSGGTGGPRRARGDPGVTAGAGRRSGGHARTRFPYGVSGARGGSLRQAPRRHGMRLGRRAGSIPAGRGRNGVPESGPTEMIALARTTGTVPVRVPALLPDPPFGSAGGVGHPPVHLAHRPLVAGGALPLDLGPSDGDVHPVRQQPVVVADRQRAEQRHDLVPLLRPGVEGQPRQERDGVRGRLTPAALVADVAVRLSEGVVPLSGGPGSAVPAAGVGRPLPGRRRASALPRGSRRARPARHDRSQGSV